MNRDVIKRSLVYETFVFFYATGVAWLFIGNPIKSLLLTVIVTLTKYPLYCAFHIWWNRKQ